MDRPDVSECWWQTEGDVKTNREAWEAITAREKPAQQTETAVLSIPVMCPFDDAFAICSPSQTSLIIDQGPICCIQANFLSVKV